MKKLLVVVTSVAMIVINLFANIVPYNNQTTKDISDSFKVFFVPAGYVFAIWGVIYLGIILFNVLLLSKQGNSKKLDKVLWAVIVSNIANSVWIFLWHYNYVSLSVVVMLVLLLSLIYVYLNLNVKKDLTKNEYLMAKVPFGIYLGWITVATVANITVALYNLNWNGFGIEGQIWSTLLVIVAALLGIVMLLRHRDVAYALVIIWAVLGIAVNFSGVSPLNTISFGSCLVLSFVVVYTVYKKFLRKA